MSHGQKERHIRNGSGEPVAAGVEKGKLQALMGGDFATATSELAVAKARNRAVRTFAELEIAEQAAVAEAFGSKPGASGLSGKHQTAVQKLQAAKGVEFDRMYINGQIDGHEELLTTTKPTPETATTLWHEERRWSQ
ncbi:DUF4142 domain-containing protein [Rhizobium bangladeshense]|uniref:DUF4142 domain-containing protein n=1 Tax=Rhizobium bangladeshense TaxID=1138189 RepID=A0ABS7LIH3_9HYPH|nr:DUF4142 domain-containing protein [Rhizobium bangladeshense]MBX4867377.1 DUF4142 domain-containing protein [Rhizobium bangladeshense]MBX4871669.1 DUF4142 domain-containing protein [Rhizobium bangladeshense]MBX4882983.1 DUF4142 domain-containing protein [Rhizobium bangladeshense]MBX4896848.1 DUF4142 domain-containing protein [Rhizobium bangladeshense]MBX4915820.1 DUF4142 domain-containing protein [Rhizobium bangladeshense]